MNKLNSDIEDFIQNRSKHKIESIHDQLMVLASTNDLSLFDLKNGFGLKFFINLYELMNIINIQSTTTWFCIEVLLNACKNRSTCTSLIKNYNFIPTLSRFMGNHLTPEKKKLLLRVLRCLSNGIKITWQIPNLCQLIRTLSDWVDLYSQDEEIGSLSLAVLVNLCYKNLPVMNTLMRQIDIKQFFRICISLKGPAIEMTTCKLLLIFDYQVSPEIFFKTFIDNTFKSILDPTQNTMIVEQTVEFFIDICEQETYKKLLKSYNYKEQMEIFTKTIFEENEDFERLLILMKFLNYLIEHCYDQLNDFHLIILDFSLECTKNEYLMQSSLEILSLFVLRGHRVAIDKIISNLPFFLSSLQDENTTNSNGKIVGIILLLRALLTKNIREIVLEQVKDLTLLPLFQTILNDNDLNIDNIALNLNLIALVIDLSNLDPKWGHLQELYQQNENVHKIIAYSLLNGSTLLKKTAIESFTCFSSEAIAKAIDKLKLNENSTESTCTINETFIPQATVAQSELLDQILNRLKVVTFENNSANVLASDIMEMYEYKLSELKYAEHIAQMSANSASEQCIKQKHRIIMLNNELNRLRELLFEKQKQHEDSVRINGGLKCEIRDVMNKYEANLGLLKVTKMDLKRLTDDKKQIEEHNVKLTQTINKTKENTESLEKSLQKKEELIQKNTVHIENLITQISELEKTNKELERDLHEKNIELKKVSKDLLEKKTIIDTITKLATKNNYTD